MRKMIIDIYPPGARQKVKQVSFVWRGARSLTLILFVILSAVFINAVGATVAYYSDSETSRGNFFSAASLDFTVKAEKKNNDDCEDHDDDHDKGHDENRDRDYHNDRGGSEDCGGNNNLSPGGLITQFATISNNGSLDFQYTIKVEKTGGDDNFCRALSLEAELEGVTAYTGKLMDFISLPVIYSTSTDDWKFVTFLPSDAEVRGSCSFDFVFSGWQTTLPEFGGFSNIERVDDPVHSIASVTVKSEVKSLATTTEATFTLNTIEEATTTEATSTSVVIEEVTTTATTTIDATTTDPILTPIVIEEPTTTPIMIEEATITEPEATLASSQTDLPVPTVSGSTD